MKKSLAVSAVIILFALSASVPTAFARSGFVYEVKSIEKVSTDQFTVRYTDSEGEVQQMHFNQYNTDEDGLDSLNTAFDHLENNGGAGIVWKMKDDKYVIHLILGASSAQQVPAEPLGR